MTHELVLSPVAHIRTDFPTKFGIPRQAGLAGELTGRIRAVSRKNIVPEGKE